MGVVTEHTNTTAANAKTGRPERQVQVETYHADADCDQIARRSATIVMTDVDAADAGFTCDWCVGTPVVAIIDPHEDLPFEVLPTGGRSGARRNQYGDANAPSDKQEAYIRSLLAKVPDIDVDVAIQSYRVRGVWTKREVSRLIDEVKAMIPAAVRNTRTNRYPGTCSKCGNRVEAEAGVLTGSAGSWGADHKDGECTEASSLPETTTNGRTGPSDPPEGMHRLEDGSIYKCQVAHHGSGNKYAKLLIVEDGVGRFQYAPGAVRKLSDATLMTLEEAKSFGALYGVCCVCAATLTDERSIAAGIGPVCAARF